MVGIFTEVLQSLLGHVCITEEWLIIFQQFYYFFKLNTAGFPLNISHNKFVSFYSNLSQN